MNTIDIITTDANAVTIDTNVRTVDPDTLDQTFVDSIAQHGVIQPVVGYRTEDGTVHIRFGQRRTLAARLTGTPLPVVITNHDDSDSARIIEQLIENDHRDDLSPAERIQAHAQLELHGLTVPKIAKATGTSKQQVTAALAIAKSEGAAELANNPAIDLLHLAATLEFARDTATQQDLLDVAAYNPSMFEHRLQAAQDRKESRTAMLDRCDEIDAIEGKAAIRGRGSITEPYADVKRLERRDDLEVTIEGEPDIRTLVDLDWSGRLTEYDVMVNFEAYGYGYPFQSVGTGGNSGPMTDEQKAERKRLIHRNKAWDAATTVRLRWLGDFLRGKTIPRDASAFIATSLARYPRSIGDADQSVACDLLRVKRNGIQRPLATLVEEQPNKAGLVTLAITLGAFESSTSRETWRTPTNHHRAYLLQLQAWGYALSPVERIAVGEEVTEAEETDFVPATTDTSATDAA